MGSVWCGDDVLADSYELARFILDITFKGHMVIVGIFVEEVKF